jgi:ribosomal protein S21|tara:strand:- start:206 stop:427 length:222 start_codon:yes stop_codon:yes gene_type:complete
LPKVNVTHKNFDFALRKFKRKVSKDNTLQEFRERMYYVKPAQKRRKAKMAGVLRWRKKERELDPVRFGRKRMY